MTINNVIDAAVARLATAQPRPEMPSARQVNAAARLQTDVSLIKAKAENANQMASRRNTTVRYSVHEASNVITVKVMDQETGKVIREIPPTKFLDMMAHLRENVGFVINEAA